MSNSRDNDSVVVRDRAGRRRFFRVGGGFLVAAGSIAASGSALADCDSGGSGKASTDQDSGEEADPKGCQSRNIISRHQPERTEKVRVSKVKA